MFPRLLALAALLFAAAPAHAQEAFNSNVARSRTAKQDRVQAPSAWLDLRQTANTTPQSAPRWVEAISMVPLAAQPGVPASTVFRIRISRPRADFQLLHFRLFFEDKPAQRPRVVAWDESGTQVVKSAPLGGGIDLPISETVVLPMIGVSCIDVEVPGDGANVRGVFLDWMTSRQVAQPLAAEPREVVPEPFAAAAPLSATAEDKESFGTVTAPLAPETIRIGASVQTGAAFQFGIESQPLAAMISFEIASARIDSPPELYVNGEHLGAVSLTLPDLADPAYRGEKERLVAPMRFHYTGWLRAQKLIPAANLRVGKNDILLIGGPGTPASAIRSTQIQLKYLWEKSDYLLQTGP